MSSWVLKFQQAERADQSILLHVSQKGKDQSLDLDLLATDGDSAYRTKVRERSLKKYQAESFEGSDEEWQQIVRYGLVSKSEAAISDVIRKNLEVGCVLSGKKTKATLAITFRSRVEEITHKLGSIDLAFSEDTDDVDLFSWATQAVEQRDSLAEQLQEEKSKTDSDASQISELEAKLKDLVEAKDEHEEQLLSKFAVLLNEKKAYIRRQQATIASADAPPVVPDTTSAGKKRKKPSSNIEKDEESDGFEPMQVDKAGEDSDKDGTSSSRQTTPRRSSASDDDDDEEEDLSMPSKVHVSQASKDPPHREASKTPPPRALPFGSGKKKANTQAQRSSASREDGNKSQGNQAEKADDDTESEQDEL